MLPVMGVGLARAEVRLQKKLTVGGSLAVGQIRLSDGALKPIFVPCDAPCDRATVVMVGGQLLGYAIGDFRHGMQVGLDMNVAHISVTESRPQLPDRHSSETFLAPGVVVGYKLVTRSGFTFNPQLAGLLAMASDKVLVVPKLGVDIGWSF